MEITPLANALGAEIHGVNIITHPSDADIDEIRSIWHKHHIIVFRGIDWTPDEHMAFSRRFGDLDDLLLGDGEAVALGVDRHLHADALKQ